MSDTVSPEVRSRIMSKVGSVSAYEGLLASYLAEFKVAVERNVPDLPGRPDLYLPASRLAVFVHGCFWHGCRLHYREPKSNVEFWRGKVERNRERDRLQARRLRRLGIRTMTVWTHEDPVSAAVRILLRVRRKKSLDGRKKLRQATT